MDGQFTNEKQLLADIDVLREHFPQTQDLYREVCALVFFRYGMTPTANKLYQLVRKGSMTAPAEALTKFWEDLREKSRVRIEHPDLPEALKTAAGELAAALWSNAQTMAHETLAACQDEARATAVEARANAAAAEARARLANDALEKIQHDLQHANQRANTLEQRLAAAGATSTVLESQVSQVQQDKADYQQRLDDARREFNGEMEKLRAAASQAAAKAAAEIGHLQAQLGDIRQSAGILEGNLQAVTSNRDQLAAELQAVREKLSELPKITRTPRNKRSGDAAVQPPSAE